MVSPKPTSNSNRVVDKLISSAETLGLNIERLEIVLSVKSVVCDFVEFNGRLIIDPDIGLELGNLGSAAKPSDSRVQETLPRWNGKELWFKDRAVKRFRRPARNQQTILAVFQEEGWPNRIDNPIPANEQCDAQSRLHDTIKSLNRNHIPDPSPIRFRGDGTGTGVVWEIVSE